MSESDSIHEHYQKIWSNWRERSGQCQSCPHWGNGGGKSPHYGVGEINQDTPIVAFVGHEGGTSGNPALEHIVTREMPDLSKEQVEEVKEYITSSSPESFETQRSADLMDTGMCNGDLTEDGTPHSPYMKTCYDAFRDTNENQYGLYFTNIKKCGESYAFDEDTSGSREATEQCIGYLAPELERVAPDVVVPFGNKAAGAIFSNYEFKKTPPSGFVVEHPYDASGIRSESLNLYETKDGIGVIPSIHFSEGYFNQNFPQMIDERDDLPDDMSRSAYWKEMVKVVDRFLDSG